MPSNLPERRSPVSIREREILRVAGDLHGLGSNPNSRIETACTEVLRWAQRKAASQFPAIAWDFQSFEQIASGRSRFCVSFERDSQKIWAIRAEDPDAEQPGRIWTTEIALVTKENVTKFTTRLIVGSPEASLGDVEPHVPGIVRQVIARPGLNVGIYRLTDKPLTVRSEAETLTLIDALLDSSRTLPIIVLSVPEFAAYSERPLLNAHVLAQSCAGLAIVIVLPGEFAWTLTERLGKRLSVYEGAVRVYLPGFTEDANPFGGHELVLQDRFSTADGVAATLKRLRWASAMGSVSRLSLGKDVPSFAALRLQSLEQQQLSLRASGASTSEQLETAHTLIDSLQAQLEDSERYQSEFSALHTQAEERAESSESQVRASGFRIQQLLRQIGESGIEPDANIALPADWNVFAEWCDTNLAGRVTLTPQARRELRSTAVLDVALAARCLLWLANDFRILKITDGDGSLRDRVIEPGIHNAHCGNDSFSTEWQSGRHDVDWHIKNGGNTRDRQRCLRIYYFWDDSSQQAIVASMPEHRRTDAS